MPIKHINLKRIRTRNIIMFTIVVFILATVYTAVHYYIYRRLVWGFDFESANAKRLLGLALFLLANTYFVARILARMKITPTAVAFDWIGSIWMGMAFYLFIVALAGHIVLFVGSRLGNDLAPFRHHYGVSIIAMAIAICGYAYYRATHTIDITRIQVGVKNLPADLDGFRIVQVSDLHLGIIVDRNRAIAMADRINALSPDLVVMTGDIVDEAPGMLNGILHEFERMKVKYGMLASVGNHEFFHGVDEVVESAEKAGIHFLRNTKVVVAGGIIVYGVDDPVAERMGGKSVRIADVVDAEAKQRPAILLYHRPVNFEQAASLGIDLQLSGHTHNGQLWPFTYIVKMIFPRITGRFDIYGSTMYVSRGIGTWGAPMRFNSPPEIVEITLRNKR